jgi:acyl carrier protein
MKLFELPLESANTDLQLGDPPQWDSMGHMELLVAVENEFDVRFPAHQIATLTSVSRIADAVRAHEQL